MKYFLMLLFSATALFVHGQYTKANAEVCSAADGPVLVTLKDSLNVTLGPQESGWYPITFRAIVVQEMVTTDSVIMADAILIDQDKNEVGKTSGEVKAQLRTIDKRGFRKHYEVLIKGFVKSYGIIYSSLPEKKLEKILNQKSISVKQEQLRELYKQMGFEEHRFENFTVYAYLDKSGTLGEPMYRTLVFVRGETLIYAVVSRHSHMNFEKIKEVKKEYTGNYYFFQRPPDKTWKEIEDIVYNFIPL